MRSGENNVQNKNKKQWAELFDRFKLNFDQTSLWFVKLNTLLLCTCWWSYVWYVKLNLYECCHPCYYNNLGLPGVNDENRAARAEKGMES